MLIESYLLFGPQTHVLRIILKLNIYGVIVFISNSHDIWQVCKEIM